MSPVKPSFMWRLLARRAALAIPTGETEQLSTPSHEAEGINTLSTDLFGVAASQQKPSRSCLVCSRTSSKQS